MNDVPTVTLASEIVPLTVALEGWANWYEFSLANPQIEVVPEGILEPGEPVIDANGQGWTTWIKTGCKITLRPKGSGHKV